MYLIGYGYASKKCLKTKIDLHLFDDFSFVFVLLYSRKTCAQRPAGQRGKLRLTCFDGAQHNAAETATPLRKA
jgi:hypothetical protein